jgi:hypothetical protein
MATEVLESPQHTRIFAEEIISWSNASEAALSITDDQSALGQSGCSFSSNGNTQAYGMYTPGSSPQGCGSGQNLAAIAILTGTGLAGTEVETQCGTFTISIVNLVNPVVVDSQGIADGYLNNAAGRLLATMP